MFITIITLLGSLALFIYGMNMMSNGLQKGTGDEVRRLLPMMKSNRFKQILAGIAHSTTVQSSSATTVTVVSLVNASILTLAQGIGVIMGANIGTTVTVWLIALLGFTIGSAYIGYPILLVGFVTMLSKKSTVKNISEAIIGLAFILIGLQYMQDCIHQLNDSPQLMEALTNWASHGFASVIIYVVIGIVLAFVLQSSSTAITLTFILLIMGWIPMKLAAAMTLGANIGTTLTANLVAAKAGSVQARRATLVHLLFNLTGVIFILIFFNPFTRLCCAIASGLGFDINIQDFESGTPLKDPNAEIYSICLIHTLFNVFATCLLVWFNNLILKVVTFLVKDEQNESESRIRFIGQGPIGAPEVAITQAIHEVVNFGEVCYEGFSYISKAINETNPDKFAEYKKKLVEYEELTDKFEYRIADFLNKITTSEINETEAEEIKVLYRVIGELESLGDSGENIGRILEREHAHKRNFNEEEVVKLNEMVSCVDNAFKVMNANIKVAAESPLTSIDNAYKAEEAINEMRNSYRDEGIKRIGRQGEVYQSFNYFLDIISELEEMGDFMINVSQAILRKSE